MGFKNACITKDMAHLFFSHCIPSTTTFFSSSLLHATAQCMKCSCASFPHFYCSLGLEQYLARTEWRQVLWTRRVWGAEGHCNPQHFL